MVKVEEPRKKATVVEFEGDQERNPWVGLYMNGQILYQGPDVEKLLKELLGFVRVDYEHLYVEPEAFKKSFGVMPKELKDVQCKQ